MDDETRADAIGALHGKPKVRSAVYEREDLESLIVMCRDSLLTAILNNSNFGGDRACMRRLIEAMDKDDKVRFLKLVVLG